jgi:hypothetical protein
MRLWSLHPRYLDRQGLTAAWREALLAQAVLAGRTRGYRSHPQLSRFAGLAEPVGAIGAYLEALADEPPGAATGTTAAASTGRRLSVTGLGRDGTAPSRSPRARWSTSGVTSSAS